MATRVEAFFDLQDRMSKKLEYIGRASQQTEDKIRELNRNIEKMTAVQQAAGRASEQMARSMGFMAASAQNTEGHVKQLTHQVERMIAELKVLDSMRVEPHIGADTSEYTRKMSTVFAGVGTGGVFAGVSGAASVAILGGIAGLVAPAVAAIGALGGAAAVALPAVAALGGGIAAAMGVGMIAMKPVIEGYGQIKQAEEAIKNAQSYSQRKAAIDQLALAQARLTQEQMQFIQGVKALKQEFTSATKPGQESIFSAVTALMQTARELIPVVAPLLNQFAAVLNQAAQGIKAFFGDPREQELLRRTWEPLIPVFRTFLSIFGNLAKIFQGVVIAATPLLTWLLDGINEKLGGIADVAMSDSGLARWTQWFDNLKPVLREVWRLVTGLWDGLKELARAGRSLLPSAVTIILALVDAVVDLLPSITNVLLALEPAFLAVARLAPAIAQFINDLVVPAVNLLARGIEWLVGMFLQLPTGGRNAVLALVTIAFAATKLQKVFGFVMTAIGGIRTALSVLARHPIVAAFLLITTALILLEEKFGFVTGVVRVLGDAWDWLGDRARDVGSVFKSIAGGIRTAFTAVKDAVMSVLGVIYDGFRFWWNNVLANIVNGAAWVIDKIPGVDVGRVPEIPERSFAEGGIVKRPTIALIGEDGPEAVVPMTKPGRAGAVAQGAGIGGGPQIGNLVSIGTVHVSNGDDYETFIARLRKDIRVAARDVLSVPAG